MASFQSAFAALQESAADSFDLIGDALLVEELPKEELKSKGGIILAPQGKVSQVDGIEANRPTFVRVLAVGNGYVDSEGETVPVEANPGDIILVGRLSVNWFSTFGPLVSSAQCQLGITRECEIKLRFKGEAGYQKAYGILSEFNKENTASSV